MRVDRDHAVTITYYKRFRMEIDLDNPIESAALPLTFGWVSWDESLLEAHAEVKYHSFLGEVDAYVFPCLGDRHGCRQTASTLQWWKHKSGGKLQFRWPASDFFQP